MKYYKSGNIAVQYGDPIELKIDGKVVEPNGALMAEVIQLGEEITKEDYESLLSV